MIGPTEYTVEQLAVLGQESGKVAFRLDTDLSSHADYILEFAGETLPLTDAARLSDKWWTFFPAAWTAPTRPR